MRPERVTTSQRRLGQALPRLGGYPVLLVSGEDDARRDPSDGPSLDRLLTAAGATTLVVLPAGHGLTCADRPR